MRTANDSYFVAMTYPEGLPSTLQPTDLHDATWGVFSAVYGGAVHPTAEGHAAMADAALAAARRVLGLAAKASVVSEPLAAAARAGAAVGSIGRARGLLDRRIDHVAQHQPVLHALLGDCIMKTTNMSSFGSTQK